MPARMSGQAWKWKLPVFRHQTEAGVRGRAGEAERIVWPAQGAQGSAEGVEGEEGPI